MMMKNKSPDHAFPSRRSMERKLSPDKWAGEPAIVVVASCFFGFLCHSHVYFPSLFSTDSVSLPSRDSVSLHSHDSVLIALSLSSCDCHSRLPPPLQLRPPAAASPATSSFIFSDFSTVQASKVTRDAIRKAPHFDDVVELDEDDDEMPNMNIISSSNGNRKKVKGKGLMDMFMKPCGLGGKKNGHLVGTVEHKDVQKRLRLDAVQKICRWLYDSMMMMMKCLIDTKDHGKSY
ncbi:hypothetical protein LXL04_015737 [Taraxacum kok-saghyz]